MNRGEAFGFGPIALRPPQCTTPLSLRLPLFYSFKKGVVFLINFLPTESNYLGSPLYLILCYIQKGARAREGPVPTLYTPIALGDGFLHDNG